MPADPEARERYQDRRTLAQALTAVERGGAAGAHAVQGVSWDTAPALIVGVTGPPGAGKSTLVDQLIAYWTERELRVAVLAVDPSSPFSHGALLGDRVRMGRHDTNTNVLIRSVATRGAGGGVSTAVAPMIRVLATAGFDRIVVETVGVGQVELDIAALADITMVVLAPGLGDGIQAAKAGILEIADVFAINKSDRPEAARTKLDLERSTAMARNPRPVCGVTATTGEGVAEVVDVIEQQFALSGKRQKSETRVASELAGMTRIALERHIEAILQSPEGQRIIAQVIQDGTDVGQAVAEISSRVRDAI